MENLGIKLTVAEVLTVENKGLRSIIKLILNALWGKFC